MSNTYRSGNSYTAGNAYTPGNGYTSGNSHTAGNSYTPGNASVSQVPGEAEYNEYANTTFAANDPWESARLLHQAVAKGYPPAIAENWMIRRGEILGCMLGAMLYAPFFGLLVFLALCFALMALNPPLPFEPDMVMVYAVIVYILVPVIYAIQKAENTWL